MCCTVHADRCSVTQPHQTGSQRTPSVCLSSGKNADAHSERFPGRVAHFHSQTFRPKIILAASKNCCPAQTPAVHSNDVHNIMYRSDQIALPSLSKCSYAKSPTKKTPFPINQSNQITNNPSRPPPSALGNSPLPSHSSSSPRMGCCYPPCSSSRASASGVVTGCPRSPGRCSGPARYIAVADALADGSSAWPFSSPFQSSSDPAWRCA